VTAEGLRLVTEERIPGDLPLWAHPGWSERFPWLVQGVTSAGAPEHPFDLGLFGAQPVGEVLGRWKLLRERLGMPAVAHARQVHDTAVLVHRVRPDEGLLVAEGYDAHLTALPGLLLSASVADCVPVSIVDSAARAVAVVHAGWRGVAGGIVERALEALRSLHGSDPASLWLHCGPAICGRCYEVGPEVHQAVHPGLTPPAVPTPIDLRRALGRRALAAGLAPERVSLSTHCTLCGDAGFFSHRGGSKGRQMALLGIRDEL
jgi:YfiH family protein